MSVIYIHAGLWISYTRGSGIFFHMCYRKNTAYSPVDSERLLILLNYACVSHIMVVVGVVGEGEQHGRIHQRAATESRTFPIEKF